MNSLIDLLPLIQAQNNSPVTFFIGNKTFDWILFPEYKDNTDTLQKLWNKAKEYRGKVEFQCRNKTIQG